MRNGFGQVVNGPAVGLAVTLDGADLAYRYWRRKLLPLRVIVRQHRIDVMSAISKIRRADGRLRKSVVDHPERKFSAFN